MLTDTHYPDQKTFFANLANVKIFSKLDSSLQAYQQMLLDSELEKYLINTHLGLYQYTRLPFWATVASALAIFQRAMDIILQGVPGVMCYIDDILVSGETSEQHLDRME